MGAHREMGHSQGAARAVGPSEGLTEGNTLAWKIPWTKELGRLQSMGSQRVGHN